MDFFLSSVEGTVHYFNNAPREKIPTIRLPNVDVVVICDSRSTVADEGSLIKSVRKFSYPGTYYYETN